MHMCQFLTAFCFILLVCGFKFDGQYLSCNGLTMVGIRNSSDSVATKRH